MRIEDKLSPLVGQEVPEEGAPTAPPEEEGEEKTEEEEEGGEDW